MADLRNKSQSYYATRLTNRMGAAARKPVATRNPDPTASSLVTMGSLQFSSDPHREAHTQDLHMQGHAAPTHASAGMMRAGAQIGRFDWGRSIPVGAIHRAVDVRNPNSGVMIDREDTRTPAEKAEAEADEADAKAREERGDFANLYTWQKIKAKQKRLGQVAGVPGHEAERDQLVHELAGEHERIESIYEKATRAYKERQASQSQPATGETFVRHQRRGAKTFDQTVHKPRRRKRID